MRAPGDEKAYGIFNKKLQYHEKFPKINFPFLEYLCKKAGCWLLLEGLGVVDVIFNQFGEDDLKNNIVGQDFFG